MFNKLKIYFELFATFFKIGAFTLGGGYAMISLIEKEVVEKKQWMAKADFVDALAVSQALPGILAVNISIMTGQRLRNLKGALVATLGTVLPSFLMILTIAIFFTRIYDEPAVIAVFNGIRPAVVALIIAPVFSTAKSAKVGLRNVWIPVVGALLIWLLGVSPIYIILGAIVYGITRVYFKIKKN